MNPYLIPTQLTPIETEKRGEFVSEMHDKLKKILRGCESHEQPELQCENLDSIEEVLDLLKSGDELKNALRYIRFAIETLRSIVENYESLVEELEGMKLDMSDYLESEVSEKREFRIEVDSLEQEIEIRNFLKSLGKRRFCA